MCVETPNFRLKPLLAQRVGGIYMWGLENALEAHGCQVEATLSAMQKKGEVFPSRDSDHLYFHRCMCQIFTASDRCRVATSLPPQTVTVLPDRYHPRPLLVRYNTYGAWLKPLFIIILCTVSFIFAFKQPWLHGNEELAPCHLPGKQIRL